MSVYAFSDLHGQYKLWEAIKNYCKEDDQLIFLGDAIDRGPDGIKIIQELLADSRVIYLKGNHEQMLCDAYEEICNNELYYDIYNSNKYLWLCNGGLDTEKDFNNLLKEEKYNIYYELSHLKEYIQYKNIFLCHAGGNYNQIENPAKLNIWDRNHINATEWNGPDSMIVVHGHTPVQHIRKDYDNIPTIHEYCNGHKIDIDLGCFYSNRIALLDLDTLEPIYLESKKEIINE